MLAAVLSAGGFVWASAVTDEVLDDTPTVEAAEYLIDPSVDSIDGSGSVTHTVTNTAAVKKRRLVSVRPYSG